MMRIARSGAWLALCFTICSAPAGAQMPKTASSRAPATAEVRVPGGCPFEGCRLGRWTTRHRVQLYQAVNGAPAGSLPAGTRVVATAAEIRAIPRKAVVTKLWDSDRAAGLRVGSVVDVLHPGGEGTVVVMHGGRIIQGSLDLEVRYLRPLAVAPLRWTWWVRVHFDKQRTAWVRNPQGQFSGMDEFGVD